jgi:glycerol-3-phosphate dehydrogenase
VDDVPRHLSNILASRSPRFLGIARTGSTVGLAIGGGKDFSPQHRKPALAGFDTNSRGMDHDAVRRLLERYGTRPGHRFLVDKAAVPLTSDPEFTLPPRSPTSLYTSRRVHLIDVVIRRTNIAFVGGVVSVSSSGTR